MAKKIDKSTADAIRQLLQQYDVKEGDRIVIDLKNRLISGYDESGISDLLSIRGTISDERAQEWLKENNEMRQEW
jgi:anti-anti-sigma regulatory factor